MNKTYNGHNYTIGELVTDWCCDCSATFQSTANRLRGIGPYINKGNECWLVRKIPITIDGHEMLVSCQPFEEPEVFTMPDFDCGNWDDMFPDSEAWSKYDDLRNLLGEDISDELLSDDMSIIKNRHDELFATCIVDYANDNNLSCYIDCLRGFPGEWDLCLCEDGDAEEWWEPVDIKSAVEKYFEDASNNQGLYSPGIKIIN